MKYLDKELVRKAALDFGFSDLRFVSAKPLLEAEERFKLWQIKGYAADMSYMKRANPINARPEFLLKSAKTLLIFTADYYNPVPERPSLDYGRIANYAVGLDYHKILKKKVKELISKSPIFKEIFSHSRFFTDAVPLLEKSFAAKAGLGFQGKNTLLISKISGSYKFIAEFITDIEFEPDEEFSEHYSSCGECKRCANSCPTGALNDTYLLDSRKCISYWTIEHRGEIPESMQSSIGEWLFGCDICQEICPYNLKASTISARKKIFSEFLPESGVGHWLYLPLLLSFHRKTFLKYFFDICQQLGEAELINFTNREIAKNSSPANNLSEKLEQILLKDEDSENFLDRIWSFKFSKTPLSRAKRIGLIRNALIVTANSKGEKSVEIARHLSS